MSELPSGTLTVLHTDVEASTLLTVHLGDRYPVTLPMCQAATNGVLWRLSYSRSSCRGGL